jgi:nucleoside-diphosphate-sugar epimerase
VTGRILVTGAGGFCGGAVAAALAASGADVIAVVRPGGGPAAAGTAVVCDLADPTAVAGLVRDVRPDLCVHAAAAGARARCDDIAQLLRVNVEATAALATALAAHGARRLVTLGSSSEYGTPDCAMREELAPAPDDPYGVSKLAGGLMARALTRGTGLETVHLRLFSVYGPGEDAGRLVPSVLGSLAGRRPVDMTPGEQVRDFIYVGDVVRAVELALRAPGVDGATLNIGTGVATTVRELAETACEVTGADPALLRFGALPYRPGERFAWRADPRLAEAWLGFVAGTSLHDGLALTLEAMETRAAA